MKIALLQQDIIWNDSERNRRRAEETIHEHPGADLYMLPEMFTTGFAIEPASIAEHEGKKTLTWMKEVSTATNAGITGSVIVEEAGNYYNRMFFVTPDGEAVPYDKHHLFSYGKENLYYMAGQNRRVVTFRGIRFLLQICYDLRFPVFSRSENDYDAILYVANWPASRIKVWETLLRARAIENQCFVAGVNRVGDDPACHYSGASAIIDAYGRTMAECSKDEEQFAMADWDIASLESFRKKFPVLMDRDRFKLLSPQK